MRIALFTFLGTLAAIAGLAGCRSTLGLDAPASLAAPPRSVPVGTSAELDAAVDGARVVCVGEFHDQRPHHDFQFDVLARMARRPGPLLLGMEMFQRPSQQHLDDYVAGRIDEREMLRRTEYYERWKFDHTFYAPMWRLARDRGIRIVALNPHGPINSKVGRSGLASLTPEERAGIAGEIDLGNVTHRDRVIGVFQSVHPMPADRLETMYEAMTVWDETMAESAARALAEAGPDSRMLIVAGSQHIQQFNGVPGRLARRVPGLSPLVVVCGLDGVEEEGLAPQNLGHFVVKMPPGDLKEAPRLGVMLDAGMKVTQVVPGGLAEKHGVKAGWTLLRIALPSGRMIGIRDTTDLRFALGECHLQGGTTRLVCADETGKELAPVAIALRGTADAKPAGPAR